MESETVYLTLSSNYVPSWGMKEGLRELIQNYLDAGGREKPEYNDGTLSIENPNAHMNREVLIIGVTTKAGKSESRGEFGEGLKLGTLALLRDGCDVKVHVSGEVWTARIGKHPTLNREVLAWDIEHVDDGFDGVCVQVFGLTGEDWASVRTLFRWGGDPTKSTLLLGDDKKGMVYVKNIHVLDHDNLAFGYDLCNLPTDRDRRLVDNYQLGKAAAVVMFDALADGTVTGDEVLEAFEADSLETRNIPYYDKRPEIRQELTSAWQKKYEDVIPMSKFDFGNTEEKLRKLGKQTRTANSSLIELLDVPDGRQVLKDLKDGRCEYKMLPHEVRNLSWATSVLEKSVGFKQFIRAATFLDDNIGFTFDCEDGRGYISSKALQTKTGALAQICTGSDIPLEKVFDYLLREGTLVKA